MELCKAKGHVKNAAPPYGERCSMDTFYMTDMGIRKDQAKFAEFCGKSVKSMANILLKIYAETIGRFYAGRAFG